MPLMDVVSGLAEMLRLWIEGAPWEAIRASSGFHTFVVTMAALVGSSIVGLGIGLCDWRETPLANLLGVSPHDPDADANWAERARDLDKDGSPDF